MASHSVQPEYTRAATSTPTPTSPPATQQLPPGQQQQFSDSQQQGQFQPAYFQPYDASQQQQFQHFQQHQQQQFQQQLQQQQQHPVYVANALKAWVYTKLALHAASIICSICVIALSFSMPDADDTRYVFILCTPIFFLALIWDAAEIVTWLVRKRVAGIHPGAHVGVSLIIWLGAACIGGIQSAYVSLTAHDNDDDTCWDSGSQEYVDCQSSSSSALIAAAAFACLVWFLHFTLFVGACVDTAKRNAANRRRVVVVGPPYWGPMAQGWQPMPQHCPPQSPGLQQTMMPVQSQNIPLQDRSQTGYGKEGGQSSAQPASGGITEYYSPSETRT
ncbi:hypothetical protein AK830_g4391 [Neonectria ditissima]|uniref:MARVEL domain-containing protein n=1 Tax=Neonectria ditissima TaxID=78410 RepID=A0A0P7BG87_9HYPO|nr:hypothetical protein AK830_g4391 [Neonectria ditissima]